MSDLSIYLKPTDLAWLDELPDSCIGYHVHSYAKELPSLLGVRIAIIGIKEGRNSDENEGCLNGAAAIRKQLYPLFVPRDELHIADLGDIEAGHTIEDTLFAVEQVSYELIRREIIPIFIGGADYCSLGVYRAYCKLERLTNIVSIDPMFDVQDSDGEVDVYNHLSRIILKKPGFLFNYTNIGHQGYLVDPMMTRTMKRMFFDVHRLGEVSHDIQEMEPVIRQADMMCIDMRSVRMSDSPAHRNPLPNGLYGEQLCQLAAYAGMNEKLTSIAFFGYNPEFDPRSQSSQLIAQAIWCFLEGFMERHHEESQFESEQFTRFRVALKEEHEIVFYKSTITERWWLEVPYPAADGNRFKRSHFIPCSYKDYQTASEEEELPDRWWQTYQKLQ